MNFSTKQFSGPLELLLDLIGRQELTITDVSLAEVTEQYVAYVEAERDNITLANLAGFLDMAARLILLKSKALLPMLVLEDDEEEEIVDLAAQLEEYQKFAQIATTLGESWVLGRKSWARSVPPRKRQIVFVPPVGVDSGELMKLFAAVLREIPTVDQLDRQHMRDVVAVEERMMELSRSLATRGTVAFSQFVKNAKNKVDVIVSFLALLELVKQNVVTVSQEKVAQDIAIKST